MWPTRCPNSSQALCHSPQIVIHGGTSLRGDIEISGAKNAALPLIAAALLTDQTVTLINVPRLTDTHAMTSLIRDLGADVKVVVSSDTEIRLAISAKKVVKTDACDELVSAMRASILVLGPLLAREGRAVMRLPGGCRIGHRPIDLHLAALERLGAEVTISGEYVTASAPRGLTGQEIVFPTVSVGATENVLMAATLAEGMTVIRNAAREPEIVDLAKCLSAMGADIAGAGTDTIVIKGASKLHGTSHDVILDRIEAASYACAAAVTNGDVTLLGVTSDMLEIPIDVLRQSGVSVTENVRGLRVTGRAYRCVDITTGPYPAFPTDLQAQFMALFSVTPGTAAISETVFENRFMHVAQLSKLGAAISVHGNTAKVRGVTYLTGSDVTSTDLRASMSLVIAALAAHGQSRIHNVSHLDRGYAGLELKLRNVCADVSRVYQSNMV